jgi:hypothetical protein
MFGGAVLRLLLLATLVASGSMQAARKKCMITFLDGCRLHRAYEGVADDSATAYDHMGVGESEERCLARAKEYFEWCANGFHQQVRQCIRLLSDFLFWMRLQLAQVTLHLALKL